MFPCLLLDLDLGDVILGILDLYKVVELEEDGYIIGKVICVLACDC